jgi:hypothetical protein
MAVAFDAAAMADGSGTSLTFAHTVGVGSDRAIVAGMQVYESPAGSDCVSGVTYAAVALSELGRVTHATHAGVELWGLQAPATGANNVVISCSATTDELIGGSVSFTGVDQSTPFGTAGTAAPGAVTTITQDIASATDDMVIDAMGLYNRTPSAGASQDVRVDNNNGGATQSLFMSTEPGAATVTMSWSWVTAETPGQVAVNVIAAAAAGGFVPYPRPRGLLGGMTGDVLGGMH